MAAKTICDACGKDMTDDLGAGRLAFTLNRGYEARANPHYPPLVAVQVEITARICPDDMAEKDTKPGDVCAECVKRTVEKGRVHDLGSVTRGVSS